MYSNDYIAMKTLCICSYNERLHKTLGAKLENVGVKNLPLFLNQLRQIFLTLKF